MVQQHTVVEMLESYAGDTCHKKLSPIKMKNGIEVIKTFVEN